MPATVTITSEDAFGNSTPRIVRCSQVVVAHKRNVIKNPNANGVDVVQAQPQSYENPTYALQNIHFTGGANVLTYDEAVQLTKLQYDGTNAPVLTVVYGTGTTLSNNTQSTSGISCVVESFNFTLDARDTKDGYLPSGSMILRETA